MKLKCVVWSPPAAHGTISMTFSASTVDCSEFIFFRGKQIILHSLAIDSTLDARVQDTRILQDNLCTFFFLTKCIKVGKKYISYLPALGRSV